MPFLARFAVFAVIALGLGLGSAWRAVNHGFFATTERFGPWAIWAREATADADPYTIAHAARQGSLPMTTATAMTFTATRDSGGSHLSGDCTYEIRGTAFPALWWNLSAFKADGDKMPNKTGRASFSSGNITTAPDGAFSVRLSPEVQPGNWLPSQKGARVVLRLTILKPLNPDALLKSAQDSLPEISLTECL